MTHSILTNRAKHLLIVRLNSGSHIHLAPDESTPPIDPVEIVGNRKIDELIAQDRLASASSQASLSVEEMPAESEDAVDESTAERRGGKGRTKR